MTLFSFMLATTLVAGGGIPLDLLASTRILDPQYLKALAELSEQRRVAGSDFHRWRDSVQWQAVQRTVSDPDLLHKDSAQRKAVLHERYDLVRAIEKYPLWEKMPPYAAISPVTLGLWNVSRKHFLKILRRSIR